MTQELKAFYRARSPEIRELPNKMKTIAHYIMKQYDKKKKWAPRKEEELNSATLLAAFDWFETPSTTHLIWIRLNERKFNTINIEPHKSEIEKLYQLIQKGQNQ